MSNIEKSEITSNIDKNDLYSSNSLIDISIEFYHLLPKKYLDGLRWSREELLRKFIHKDLESYFVRDNYGKCYTGTVPKLWKIKK